MATYTLLNNGLVDGTEQQIVDFDPATDRIAIDFVGTIGLAADIDTIRSLGTYLTAEGWVILTVLSNGVARSLTLVGVTDIFSLTLDNFELGTATSNDSLLLATGVIDTDVAGGLGDDLLDGRNSSGYNRLFGEGGDDALYGNAVGGDYLYGGTGDDIVDGGGGLDAIFGGEGNDFILGDGELHGGSGADTMVVAGTSDGTLVYGDDGNDLLFGGADIEGGYGDDIIVATDRTSGVFNGIEGGVGSDTVYVTNARLLKAIADGVTGVILVVLQGGASGSDIDQILFEDLESDFAPPTAPVFNPLVGQSYVDYEYAPGGLGTGIFIRIYNSDFSPHVLGFGVVPPATPNFPGSSMNSAPVADDETATVSEELISDSCRC